MEETGQKLMSDLEKLVKSGRETFLAATPHPVLLVGPGARLGSLTAKTPGDEDLSTGTLSSARPAQEPTLVISVAKRFSTSTADMIWLGRAVTCDVILPYEAVSKVHAVLSHNPSGELFVNDVGSKNGTWVNRHKLKSGEQVQLTDRDILRLGNVQSLFLKPESLYEFLMSETHV